MSSALLLSGGVDSSALAYWMRPEICITVDYGQLPAAAEIAASSIIAAKIQARHEIVRVNCGSVGSGDLCGRPAIRAAHASEWWPYRNQLLVTLCAMRCLELEIPALLVGTVQSDSVHGDGRPEFFDALDKLMQCQEGGLRILAPALRITSLELISLAKIPLEVLINTHSCHTGCLPCSQCRGCRRRFITFASVGLERSDSPV